MMKKKVCFIAWERFSYGGISRVLSDIINGLCDDYDITILCLKDAQSLENVYDIDFSKVNIMHHEMTLWQKIRRELVDRFVYKLLRLFPALGIKNCLKLKYASDYRRKLISIIGNQYDIVVGATGLNESYLLSAISDKIGGEKIGWMHTSFEGYFLQGVSQRDIDFSVKMGEYHLPKLSKLIVLSKTDAGKYARFCRSIAVYNPVPFESESLANVNVKHFLFVGALSWVKGADVLIDAFVSFAKHDSDWKLHIYGDGPMWKYIEDRISEHHLKNRVFLNHSTKDVKLCYLKVGALLFPSRLEGFGIVQVEAMTCGLPILAHRLPITEELIENCHCGMLYADNTPKELSEIMMKYTGLEQNEKVNLQKNARSRAIDFQMNKILFIWKNKVLMK